MEEPQIILGGTHRYCLIKLRKFKLNVKETYMSYAKFKLVNFRGKLELKFVRALTYNFNRKL